MTHRSSLIVTLVLCTSVLIQGCAPQACERLCQWFEDVSVEGDEEPWAGCQEACEQDYSQASNACRRELRDLSDCVDGLSAESAWSECDSEFFETDEQCACSIQECVGDCEEENPRRLRTATCNAINETQPIE